MALNKLKNPFNSFAEIVKKINEVIDNIGGGGGGFTPTPEQQQAIDSGITSEILSDIETDIDNLKENLDNFIGNFNSYADLVAYSGTLTNNDYAVVAKDETHSNECWRYVYNADTSAWVAQYKINETPINTIDQSSNPTDTDSLSDLNGTNNKRWTFVRIWNWISSKLNLLLAEKVDKLASPISTEGNNRIYQCKLNAQGQVTSIATEFNWSNTYNTSAENQLFTRKGANSMYKELIDWNYVGILNISAGSALTVKDDWKELLFICRLSEGSSFYNATSFIPKLGFTQGSPTGNSTFIGFFYNTNFYASVRVGLTGTGDSRQVKVGTSSQNGWNNNGIYVYKR